MLFLRIFILSFATTVGTSGLANWLINMQGSELYALTGTAEFLLKLIDPSDPQAPEDVADFCELMLMFISASLAFGAASFVLDACLSLLRRVKGSHTQ